MDISAAYNYEYDENRTHFFMAFNMGINEGWYLCTKIMKVKCRIWMTGYSPARIINPVSVNKSGQIARNFAF